MGERYQIERVPGHGDRASYEIMDMAARPLRVVASVVGMPDAKLVASALNAASTVEMAVAAQ